jgi:hypothetical protein
MTISRAVRFIAVAVGCVAVSCGSAPADPVEASQAESQGVAESCSELGGTCSCTLPRGGLYATFRVGAESFSQQITNVAAIQDAIALWRGQSNKHIPVGRLQCSCIGWNCAWNWRMDPATITLAQNAIELCDGSPSYVAGHCPTFGGGSYCPWIAQLANLRDCRTDPKCPVVSR